MNEKKINKMKTKSILRLAMHEYENLFELNEKILQHATHAVNLSEFHIFFIKNKLKYKV